MKAITLWLLVLISAIALPSCKSSQPSSSQLWSEYFLLTPDEVKQHFESTGFNLMFCDDIPHLIDCGVLGERGGKPFVSIPMVSPEEYRKLDKVRIEQMYKMSDSISEQLKMIFPQLKINIPKHLEGRVAEFRKYYCYVITMALICMLL